MDGATILAKALRRQGVQYAFGIVGIPVVEVAQACQREGIQYIGMRNEQSASYAAGAIGYLTGRPGLCIVVSGPGLIHAIAGLSNAWSNCWPMLVVAGSSDTYQDGTGAFQEAPQIDSVRDYVKYTARPSSLDRIPFFVEKAVRQTIYGRPGAAYLDMPGDMIGRKLADESKIDWCTPCPSPPKVLADPNEIVRALETLRSAKSPLVIVGKGAAYSRAEHEIKKFLEASNFPFLPTPMGKGVVSDEHPLCVAPARSKALQSADVILLLGARLNWILHFGKPPRFRPDVKVIQVDIAAEEMHTNVAAEVALVGDVTSVMHQLNGALAARPYRFEFTTPWWTELRGKVEANRKNSEALYNDNELPMTYYRAFSEIKKLLPSDVVFVSEGANTMDIGRTVIANLHPRSRLDAGTFGTMGVGLGFAIAAALVYPNRRVVCVEGDSAFGFSGLEFETAVRYKLPITFIIINNNGIYGGLDPESWAGLTENQTPAVLATEIPVNSLLPEARYEKIADAFGAKGYFAATPEALSAALKEALASNAPTLINTMISPYGQRKAQEFGWLTKKDTDAKL